MGRGSKAYNSAVLLSLLVYGYTIGLVSSRKIERATYDLLAFRYLAANTHSQSRHASRLSQAPFAGAEGERGSRQANGTPFEDANGPSALWVAQTYRGTRLRDHQERGEIPVVLSARNKEGLWRLASIAWNIKRMYRLTGRLRATGQQVRCPAELSQSGIQM